jgi:uncharacterized damage-inducible protein DinB
VETEYPTDILPVDHRDDEGTLNPMQNQSLDDHLARLEKIRAAFVERVGPMSAEDLHTPRIRDHYDVTPAWVMNHLMQHEAEHRSQIDRIRERLQNA